MHRINTIEGKSWNLESGILDLNVDSVRCELYNFTKTHFPYVKMVMIPALCKNGNDSLPYLILTRKLSEMIYNEALCISC